MADEKVTVLVDIEVDNQQAQNNLEETTRRIEILKKERTALNTAIKKGNGITKEQAQALTAVNQALKRETEEQKKYNKQVNTTSNSLNAMRARLIANKKALGDMSQSTVKGRKDFIKLSKSTDQLSKKILAQEKGYGVATRNVGNYTSATEGLGAVFPVLGSGLAQITTALKAFTASLLVNPIFLIIAAVVALGAALFSFFTRSQKGIEKWEQIQATFNATLDVMLDRLALIGEAIFDFIELIGDDPLKAIKKFGDFITENMTNRITGFIDVLKAGGGIIADLFLIMANKIKLSFANVPILGDAIDVEATEKRIEELTKSLVSNFEKLGESAIQSLTGVDDLANKVAKAFSSINKEITEEVKLVNELTKKKQKLEKEEIKFIITNQRRLKQIAKLRLAAENENNAIEDRIKSLEKAQRLENANLQQSIKFKEREIALTLLNNDNITTQAEAISRINQLLRDGREIKIEEIGLSTSNLKDQEKLNKSIAELDKIRESSFNKQKLFEAKLTTLRRKSVKEEEEITQGTSVKSPLLARLRKEFETETKASERLRVFREEQRIQDLTDLDEKFLAEQDLILSQAQFKIDNEKLTASQIALINEKATADNIALFERKALAEEEISKRTEEAKLSVASDALGALAGLFEEGTAAYKVFATSQAIIDTYRAANAAFAALAGIPIVGPTLGTIAAGTAIAGGLANVAKINGVKFEHGGGLAEGNSHAQGGIQMYQHGSGQHLGEMEGNEYIVSAKRTREIGVGNLNAMNFGSSAPISTGHFAHGGQVSTSTRSATAIDQGDRQFKQMMRAVAMLPNPVVGVDEINAVNGNVLVKEQLGL